MGIVVGGVPASRKLPGTAFNVVFGGSPSGAGTQAKKILCVGNMIAANITGASPSFTRTAGVSAVETVYQPSGADDADARFGKGSELARMVRRAFEVAADAQVYAIAPAESGGTAASQTLTFATNATSSATLRLYLAGKTIEVALNGTSGSPVTPTAFATSVATAINAEDQTPYTAQYALGVVTVTAVHKGPRGNKLEFRAAWVRSSDNVEVEITGSAIASGTGMTGQLGAGTGTLGSGATVDSLTNTLAQIVASKYDRIVVAAQDATAIDALLAQLDTQAGPTVQIRQQAVYLLDDTVANNNSFAIARNDARGQCASVKDSPLPPPEVAVLIAAGRLYGDGTANGRAVGEASDPACNLDGLQLKGSLIPRKRTSDYTTSELESGLNNGVSVLRPSSLNPGSLELVRSVTSLSVIASQQNYSVLDTSAVTGVDYVADDLQAYLLTLYRNYKLVSDGVSPLPSMTVTPSIIRNTIIARLREHELAGVVRDVTEHLAAVQVVEDGGVPGRVNCEIPAEIVPGLHIIAANVRQLTA